MTESIPSDARQSRSPSVHRAVDEASGEGPAHVVRRDHGGPLVISREPAGSRRGTLDQLSELGDTLESIRPRLVQLAELIADLSTSVHALGRSVEPLGDLATRLPDSRRRALSSGS